MTLEQLAAGDPAAERQLRALRAVERWARSEAFGHMGNCLCDVCTAFEELDAADAAAKEREHG